MKIEKMGNPNEIIKYMLDNLDNSKIYDIIIKEHRRKRSLNANGYCWVLLEKMAEVLHSTKEELYISMLKEYGQFEFYVVKENQVERIVNRINEMVEDERFRAVNNFGKVIVKSDKGETDGVQLQLFVGSSHYDTKEMSRFIDGIINECRELEIETMTPKELSILKKEWKNE